MHMMARRAYERTFQKAGMIQARCQSSLNGSVALKYSWFKKNKPHHSQYELQNGHHCFSSKTFFQENPWSTMVKIECVWTPSNLFYDEHIQERKGPKTWLLLLHSAIICMRQLLSRGYTISTLLDHIDKNFRVDTRYLIANPSDRDKHWHGQRICKLSI